MKRRITFLTRPGCGLCDEARARLEDVVRWLPVGCEVVDISADPVLEAEYHIRIPVVLDRRGRVLAEGQISRGDALGAALRGLL